MWKGINKGRVMYDHSINFGFKPLADQIISTKGDYTESHGKTLRDMNMLTAEDIFDCKLCGECCKGFGGTYVDERDIMANSCPGMKKRPPTRGYFTHSCHGKRKT